MRLTGKDAVMTTLVYTARELAGLLGLNIKTLYEATARGEIPHRRIGRRILWPRPAIDAWLALGG